MSLLKLLFLSVIFITTSAIEASRDFEADLVGSIDPNDVRNRRTQVIPAETLEGEFFSMEFTLEGTKGSEVIRASDIEYSRYDSESALARIRFDSGTVLELQSTDERFTKAFDGKLADIGGLGATNIVVNYGDAINHFKDELGFRRSVEPGTVVINGGLTVNAELSGRIEAYIDKKGKTAIFTTPVVGNSGWYTSYGLEDRESRLFLGAKSLDISCNDLNIYLSATHEGETESFSESIDCSQFSADLMDSPLREDIDEATTDIITVETFAILGMGYKSPTGKGAEFEVILKPVINRKADGKSAIEDVFSVESGDDIPFSLQGAYRTEMFGFAGGIAADTFNGQYCSLDAHASISGKIKDVGFAVEKEFSANLTSIQDRTAIPISIDIGDDRLIITPAKTVINTNTVDLSDFDDCERSMRNGDFIQQRSILCYQVQFNDDEGRQSVIEERSLSVAYIANENNLNTWGINTTYTEDQGFTEFGTFTRLSPSMQLMFSVERQEDEEMGFVRLQKFIK